MSNWLVYSWLETTLQLTRLSGNSAEQGWSSLPTLEMTMSKRGPHSVSQQRPLCDAASTRPRLYPRAAAWRSFPIPWTEYPQHLHNPRFLGEESS